MEVTTYRQPHIFLQVVEATAASGELVYTPDSETDALAIAPITGYAVAIPTMNAIHGQESWQGEHVSEKYGDHSAWDVDTIVQMLEDFFSVANAASLPDLSEYHWRLDKVQSLRSSCNVALNIEPSSCHVNFLTLLITPNSVYPISDEILR